MFYDIRWTGVFIEESPDATKQTPTAVLAGIDEVCSSQNSEPGNETAAPKKITYVFMTNYLSVYLDGTTYSYCAAILHKSHCITEKLSFVFFFLLTGFHLGQVLLFH